MDTLLMTLNQAAEQLAIGRTTVYQLIGRGELPTVRLGRGCVRISREALIEYVARSSRRGDISKRTESGPEPLAPGLLTRAVSVPTIRDLRFVTKKVPRPREDLLKLELVDVLPPEHLPMHQGSTVLDERLQIQTRAYPRLKIQRHT